MRIFINLTLSICLTWVSCVWVAQIWSQEDVVPVATGDAAVYGVDGAAVVPLTDEIQYGLMLFTQGGGLTLRRGFYQNASKIRWWGSDLLLFKHPKEEKITNPVYEDGRAYVFGKVNSMYLFRVWRGGQKLHSEKLRKDAVRVSSLWRYGVTLGVLKPVYMEIGYPDIPYDYIATERYDPSIHFSSNIFGQSQWMYGLDELSVVPGFHVSYALDFEYGTERHVQRTLTAGVAVDAFLFDPEIFASSFEQNSRTFVTLFATFELGSNWTR
ncbi:MAG: hypothetical protein MUP94_05410 [Flavobacteriales bacterium]|nr:hypothetical protein [Flavobacteriales bacterium]